MMYLGFVCGLIHCYVSDVTGTIRGDAGRGEEPLLPHHLGLNPFVLSPTGGVEPHETLFTTTETRVPFEI